MRAAARIGLMIAAIADVGKRAIEAATDHRNDNRRRNKVARFKPGASYQEKLREHFAGTRLARYGYEVTGMGAIKPDEKTRRVFRNARKQERA